MPELPEVETMRRGIAGCVGRRIVEVERPRCSRKPITLVPRIDRMRKRLCGTTISGTSRAGKRVVVELDSDDRLVFEPRMTGLVLVADPPSEEHLRLRLTLAVGGRRANQHSNQTLMYWDRRGLGSVRLFTAEQFAEKFAAENLGPDALGLAGDVYRDRFAGSRREIKVALLDQRAVAGIGNLYAAEILHAAGIHPRTRCDAVTRAQWQRLAEVATDILTEAIRYEGSTLGDGTYRNALSQEGSYQNHHRVYGRAGETCTQCEAAEIERFVQQQRSTFFCPVCQPRRTVRGRSRKRPR